MADASSTGEHAASNLDAPLGVPGGWWRWAAFVCALSGFILLARALLLPESNLALFWPAGGVAVLGVAVARSRTELFVVLATVMGLASLGNYVTGAPPAAALWLGLTNVVLALTPALWLAYAPGLLRSPHGGPGHLLGERLRVVHATDLARLSLALLVAGLASTLPGAVAMTVLDAPVTLVALASLVVRLAVGSFVVAAPLLTLACVTRHESLTTQPTGWASWRPWLVSRGAEMLFALAAGIALIAVIFGSDHGLPLSYIPLLISVWVGVRLPPVVAGLVTLVVGFLTAFLVLMVGGGPFADIAISVGNAMTLQGYAFLLVGTALLLSLVIAERDDLGDRLASAESESRQRADDLAVITEVVPVALMTVTDGETESVNPQSADMVAKFRRGHFKKGGWRSTDGSLVDTQSLPLARALRGEVVRDQVLLEPLGIDQDLRAWNIDAVQLPSRADGAERVLFAFRDVTDQQAHLAGLESFAGIVAHDLQNPVTAIKGWADLAVDELETAGQDVHGDVGSSVLDALDRVRAATDRASGLISDLLDYSVGRTASIKRTWVDLDDLVAHAARTVSEAQVDRSPRVTVGTLGTYAGDPVLLAQVLVNLIGNAVKYTPAERRPEVRIEANRTDTELEISVLDRGVGVPPSQRASIFEPFARAHRDDIRFTGTGLGLAICSQATARHGGRIGVEARDGGGSRFFVVLPVAEADDQGLESIQMAGTGGQMAAFAPPPEATPDDAEGCAGGPGPAG